MTWGLMAEFASAEGLLAAARRVREAGHVRALAYSPFPIDGLADALGWRPRVVPVATFIGGLLGGVGGFLLQWSTAVLDYPLNIGGRPLNSWPMFVPATFELTVLGAALAAFVTALVAGRLPDLAQPVDQAPDFELASRNRFFLCLPADDPGFDWERSAQLLDSLQPLRRVEVPA